MNILCCSHYHGANNRLLTFGVHIWQSHIFKYVNPRIRDRFLLFKGKGAIILSRYQIELVWKADSEIIASTSATNYTLAPVLQYHIFLKQQITTLSLKLTCAYSNSWMLSLQMLRIYVHKHFVQSTPLQILSIVLFSSHLQPCSTSSSIGRLIKIIQLFLKDDSSSNS